MTLRELEPQLATLSLGEKAALVKRFAMEITQTWPRIDHTPGVCGGDACIVRTRIPVWVLENFRRLGWSEAKLLENYPTLHAIDLAEALAYADAHRDEIDRAIAENEAD